MTEPQDLRDLVGDDVPPEELEKLRRVDALLRSVPPPPEVPQSLSRRVAQSVAPPVRLWTRRRRAGAALALAAALAALFFGLGLWAGGDDFDARRTVALEPTAAAADAAGELRVGARMDDGNWGLEVDVSGLRRLPKDGYYVLWLAKDGRYAATCGTFTVGRDGSATVYMNASYELRKYDAWVITAHLPGQAPDADVPHLLEARI